MPKLNDLTRRQYVFAEPVTLIHEPCGDTVVDGETNLSYVYAAAAGHLEECSEQELAESAVEGS